MYLGKPVDIGRIPDELSAKADAIGSGLLTGRAREVRCLSKAGIYDRGRATGGPEQHGKQSQARIIYQ
jgi:hypothetical protein